MVQNTETYLGKSKGGTRAGAAWDRRAKRLCGWGGRLQCFAKRCLHRGSDGGCGRCHHERDPTQDGVRCSQKKAGFFMGCTVVEELKEDLLGGSQQ